MADVQIRQTTPSAAPLTYTVPQAQEIILKSLVATFDGSGAGSAWIPCVRVIPPGGGEAHDYIADTSVAAGGSARVTFAPFLRGVTSTSGGGVGVEHNDALVATEPNIDFEDGGVTWTITDDAANSRVKISGTGGGGGSGLPNAVMHKTLQQTFAGNSVTQMALDSSTFATTDGSIFSVSGSNISIAATGLYAAYIDMVNDVTDEDQSVTQLFPKWLAHAGGANAPWEQIVPRIYNVNGPAGLQGYMPDGAGLSQNIDNVSVAYCSSSPSTLGVWLATLSGATLSTSTCLVVVVQLCPISALDLASFPTYPF